MANYMSLEPCAATGFYEDGMVTYHHLLTRKAYPEHSEKDWNKFPCTQKIHNEFHEHGTVFMAEKYSGIKQWLIANNWYLLEFPKKKWFHDF